MWMVSAWEVTVWKFPLTGSKLHSVASLSALPSNTLVRSPERVKPPMFNSGPQMIVIPGVPNGESYALLYVERLFVSGVPDTQPAVAVYRDDAALASQQRQPAVGEHPDLVASETASADPGGHIPVADLHGGLRRPSTHLPVACPTHRVVPSAVSSRPRAPGTATEPTTDSLAGSIASTRPI